MTRELFQAPRTGSPQHWDDFCYCQARPPCQWVLDLQTLDMMSNQIIDTPFIHRMKSKPKQFGPRVGTRRGDASIQPSPGDRSRTFLGLFCKSSDPKTLMS